MTRRNRSQYDVRTYLGAELYERVLREAAARRLSLSECVRDDLLQFYDLRDELASALRVERSDRPTGQRILHTLLDPMEERIAASIGVQAAALSDLGERLRRLEWMIDRHYLGLMLHLPDVAEDLRDERSSSAIARHRAWKREVDQGPSVREAFPKARGAADEERAPSAAGRRSDGDSTRRTRGSPTSPEPANS